MSIRSILKTSETFVTENSPAILTGFGVTGTVITAVLTGQATVKATRSVDRVQREADRRTPPGETHRDMTKKEVVKLVWPYYVPAVTTGTMTVGAIIFANRIGSRRAAAMATAYAAADKALVEYKDKVVEKIGEKAEKTIRDEVAQDRVTQEYNEGEVLFNPVSGKVLVCDMPSGRFFYSTVDAVNQAVNEVNADILDDDSATVSDFYTAVGLKPTSRSAYEGWNTSRLLKIEWTTCTTPDGKQAVHAYDFATQPIPSPGSNKSFR